MAKIKSEVEQVIEIQRLERAVAHLYVLGTTPLMMNRMAKKVKEELLLPARKLNRAALEQRQKHDPPAEFRDAIYRCRDDNAPTLVHIPDNAFKKAMAHAALDIPGATKAQIGRLVNVVDPTTHIYGRPFLSMMPVRLQGRNKAPDIRTRAIFPRWATMVTVRYVRSIIREQDVVNLMDAAGLIVGVGDGRAEKGTFNFGSWELVQKDNPHWKEIVNTGGRKVQVEAMANPVAVDEDSEELLKWYYAEIIRRERDRGMTPAKQPSPEAIAAKKGDGNGRRRRPHANN
jgi:hypothetical protein